MTLRTKTGMGLLALLVCLGASPVQAGVKKDVEEAKHALGWDTINLKVMERDKAGHPTLEHESNAANDVDRRTSYHDDGKKKSQSVTVIDKASKKTLYTQNKEWDKQGRLESSETEDDAFNGDGKQTRGEIVEKKYVMGKLAHESRKTYSVDTGAWGETYKQEISYYKSGDMRERVTEEPPSDKKKRETWSAVKGATGRKKKTQEWDSSAGDWK